MLRYSVLNSELSYRTRARVKIFEVYCRHTREASIAKISTYDHIQAQRGLSL